MLKPTNGMGIKKYRTLIVIALAVVLSIAKSLPLLNVDTAYAITATEITYCQQHYPNGTDMNVIDISVGFDRGADFNKHHCGEMGCAFPTQADENNSKIVTGCQANPTASDNTATIAYCKATFPAGTVVSSVSASTGGVGENYSNEDYSNHGCSDVCTIETTSSADGGVYATDATTVTKVVECSGKSGTTGAASTTGGSSSTPTPTKPTCSITGIGWIVCPVMSFIAGINDALFKFISDQLTVDVKFFNTSSGTYKVWEVMRNYANIIFIVVFILIIFSQVTSVGITNYGVKKLLPKLIVIAVLVNVSYIICQLAVDISNMLGLGIKSLLYGIADSIDATNATKATGLEWVTVITGIIALVGAGIALALAISVPVIIAAVLALGSAALIIFAQKSIIILLIALAPIAIVLGLLPNTEKWYKQWLKLFGSMLVLFPTISLLFGGGRIASAILISANPGDVPTQVGALGAAVLPLLGIIPLLQNALKGTGALGQRLSGMSQAANRRMNNSVRNDSRLGRGVTQALAYRKKQRDVVQDRRNARGAISRRVFTGFGGRGYGQRQRDNAAASERAEYEEDVKAAAERQRDLTHEARVTAARTGVDATGRRLTAHERDAAIRYAMDKGNFEERRDVLMGGGSMTAEQLRSAADGARARGDHAVLGNTFLGQFENGMLHGMTEDQIEDAMSDATAAEVNGGHVSAETTTRDYRTANYVHGVVTGTGARRRGTAPRILTTPVTAGARTDLHDAIDDYLATPDGVKKDTATQGSARRI